jgi:Rieske Fe-S protein
LNQILLLRLDPAGVDDRTRALMAEDVIAYSGVCTHAACAVSEWDGEKKLLLCPCHGSQFDAGARAKVMGGPAPRPLPMLPIRRAGEGYAVAGKFTAKVGLKSA